MMRVVLTVLSAAVICAWSTVCFAWVDERSRRYRRRTITAQAALRRRIDRELQDLRVLVLDHLGIEEPTGWPEVEPERVEDPITEPIPVQPSTVPMRLAWDESAAELVLEEPKAAPVSGWQAEQDAWLRAQRAHLDELAS